MISWVSRKEINSVDVKNRIAMILDKGDNTMEEIVLSEVTGKVVGFELEDDGNATIKVRDPNGKVLETTCHLGDAPIPSGNVTIRTTIEFEKGRRSGGVKVNYLFGKNGKILIDPETSLPFPARPGPQGRGDAAKKRLEAAERKAGGRATPAQANKFKSAFSTFGGNPEEYNDSAR